MIRVFAHRQGGYYRFYATGHANYCPGEDIVCAGVSALVGALTAFAVQSTDCRHVRCRSEAGEVFLACRGGLGRAFDLVVGGLARIAQAYPDHVRVEVSTGCGF